METVQAYQWVISIMQADSALVAAAVGGFWQGNADIGVTSPYVYVGRQSGADVLTMNAKRLFVYTLLQIKAVGPVTNYATLIVMANRIDALFGRTNLIGLPSGGVLSCYRDGEIAYDDPLVNGQSWTNLGGLYRIALQGV